MKVLYAVACVLLVLSSVLMVSCSKPKAEVAEPAPNVSVLAKSLQAELVQIDSIMAAQISTQANKFANEAEIRALLKPVSQAHPAILTACYVDTKGILKYLEPEKYKSSEGADISKQAHTIAMLKDPKPIMSTSFKAVEGFSAIILGRPLFDAKDKFMGSLVLTIDTSLLPKLVMEKNKVPKNYELWAMEPDGMTVADQDKEEIALNVLSDPLYAPYTSLRTLTATIAKTPSGEGKYSFLATGTKTEVEKIATWDSFTMHDRTWRVILVKVETKQP